MQRLPHLLTGAALAALLLLPAGCATVVDGSNWDAAGGSAAGNGAAPPEVTAPLSEGAMALAQTGLDGSPKRYESADEAVRAGDAAGLIRQLYRLPADQRDEDGFNNAFLALDRAADGDLAAARRYLGITGDDLLDEDLPGFYVWLDAWFLALEGEPDAAISRHRDVADSMPGLTSDLSLAALLEAAGRTDEALAVYEALTPNRIVAPEHEFDPKGIMFAQISSVIVRHALLLQRLGRIEEAQASYQRLADSQPEQATSYAAAIESLETGRNLDNEALTAVTGFSQSLSDVSAALQQQRYLSRAFMGLNISGFDSQRAAFDLMILVVDPSNRNVRSGLVNALYEQAYYEAAAHVALAAPEPSPSLQISAAQALLMSGDEAGARGAIASALEITEEDDRLQTLYGALQLSALLNDGGKAMSLLPEVLALADNPAERAAANGLAGSIYDHFGEAALAAEHAEEARRLDDTHSRRMSLANYLGKAGRVKEALVILRSERVARPNDPYMLNSLGYFLITRTDRLDEGYRILARAMLMAEGDPYIADSLGWALYQLGDLDRARRLIEGAREDMKPQRHWEVEDHLGDIYWHGDEQDAAREAWQLALDNHPPMPERDLIARKLEEGLTTPVPEKKPIPEIRIDDGETTRRGI
ncbi:MAG: tetratricopeptide repeat protein [Hyphomonas sp.]